MVVECIFLPVIRILLLISLLEIGFLSRLRLLSLTFTARLMLFDVAIRILIHTLYEITEIIYCVKNGVGFLLGLRVSNLLNSVLIN